MRKIHFYRTESGYCPAEKFLDSLSGKQAQKVAWVLRLIEEMENIPAHYFKKLVNTRDIWEVRIQADGDIFRLLGFLENKHLFILTHACQKKTQKIPQKESRVAERRKQDYLRRRLPK